MDNKEKTLKMLGTNRLGRPIVLTNVGDGSKCRTKQEDAKYCSTQAYAKQLREHFNLPLAEVGRIFQRGMSDLSDIPPHPRETDIFSMVDKQEQIMGELDDTFARVDSRVRAMFAHDPLNLFRFINNPANRDKAIELGLLESGSGSRTGDPPSDPQAANAAGGGSVAPSLLDVKGATDTINEE